MKTFALLALLGVITYNANAKLVDDENTRNLAAVTLQGFGDGWMLTNPDSGNPLDWDAIIEDTVNQVAAVHHHSNSTKNHTHGHCHKKSCGGKDDDDEEEPVDDDDEEEPVDDDDEEEEPVDDDDEEEIVGSERPDEIGGTGDENPFNYLEEMFQNITDSLDALDERVTELADLQV